MSTSTTRCRGHKRWDTHLQAVDKLGHGERILLVPDSLEIAVGAVLKIDTSKVAERSSKVSAEA